MDWWALGGWGLFGGFIVDGIEFWRLVRSHQGVWPAQYSKPGFFAAEAVRLVVGAGLAIVFGETGQITGALGAVAIGAAAPLIVEKLAQQLPTIPPSSQEDKQ